MKKCKKCKKISACKILGQCMHTHRFFKDSPSKALEQAQSWSEILKCFEERVDRRYIMFPKKGRDPLFVEPKPDGENMIKPMTKPYPLWRTPPPMNGEDFQNKMKTSKEDINFHIKDNDNGPL